MSARHAPRGPAGGLLIAALGLALLAPALLWSPALAAKPHPLFGRSMLGNSAEAFLISPAVGPSADFVARVFDYDSVTTAVLNPQAPVNITGGEADADVGYSQLDVAMGDFDGDFRDEPIVVRAVSTGTPGQRVARLVYSPTSSQLDWTPAGDSPVATVYAAQGIGHAFPGLRLAAGDFNTDGRDELALVNRGVDGSLEINVWRLDDASMNLTSLAQTTGEMLSLNLGESGKFDAASGDVDGDGQDELIVGGVRFVPGGGTHVELFATVYKLTGGALVPKVTTKSDDVNIAFDGYGSGQHIDHVAITTGTLRSALRDQIVFSWSIRHAYWFSNSCSWCCGPFVYTAWDYDRVIQAQVAVLDVDASQSPWTVGGWNTGRLSTSITDKFINDACDPYSVNFTDTGPSLGVATGDLSGDGIDEVLLAATNKLFVYQMGAGGSLTEATSVTRAHQFTDPSRRVVAVADLNVNPDGPQRWVPEIVLQDWATPNAGPRLRVFRPVVSAAGALTGLAELCSYQQTALPKVPAEVAIALGDLNGDAVRLGEPTYHPAISATQPRVLLKSPPVHFDVFDGTVYDLAGCYDGSGSYLCDCFQATYSKQTGTTFTVKTETMTDWGASASFKANYEGLVWSVEASLEASYGQNMSRAGEVVTSYTVEQQVTTAGSDRILADEVNYDVWEYPVYAPGDQGPRTLRGTMALVRPVSVSQPRWFTFTTWPTSHNPLQHEAGNVLSYPRYGLPEQDPNIAEIWKSDRWDVTPAMAAALGSGGSCLFNFGVSWNDVVTQNLTSSWKAGVEMGASVGAYGVSVGLSGHYSQEEISTRETTVGDGIQLSVSLGPEGPVAEAPYTVQPYIYRALDGTLVLDYTVEPVYGNPGNPTWWDSHYTSDPDPALVLPKRYHAQKGLPVEDPRTRERSPSVWVTPDTAAVGDTVTVFATVHNFSLKALTTPVAVQFTIGHPDSATHTDITSLTGETQVLTPAGIGARDTATVRMRWVIPRSTASTPWVYARLDPASLVGELHEDNNTGYTTMKVSGGSSVGVEPPAIPSVYRLHPAIPNPFSGRTTIRFDLPRAGHTTLMVYDLAGRRVTTLADRPLLAGRHELAWNGRTEAGTRAPAGVYFCRLTSEAYNETRRVVLLR